MTRITTFGFSKTQPPADATLVVDCRPLHEADIYSLEGNVLLNKAIEHINQTTDPVIAFGCEFGQVRSVRLAARLGRIVGVTPVPHETCDWSVS